jgi:hypothetical protein
MVPENHNNKKYREGFDFSMLKSRLLLVRCIARHAGTLLQKEIRVTRSKQGH